MSTKFFVNLKGKKKFKTAAVEIAIHELANKKKKITSHLQIVSVPKMTNVTNVAKFFPLIYCKEKNYKEK